ncbi:ester cyclase [Streptomyces sp. NPDC005251]|uniref:ester cyclase n=1 Tax=Streptomyces sp. NPDC005251 TaxID=3157166 RepID=UPI0033BE18B4
MCRSDFGFAFSGEAYLAEGGCVCMRWAMNGTHTGNFMEVPVSGRQQASTTGRTASCTARTPEPPPPRSSARRWTGLPDASTRCCRASTTAAGLRRSRPTRACARRSLSSGTEP